MQRSSLSESELNDLLKLPVHASLLAAQMATKPGQTLAICVRVSALRTTPPLYVEQEGDYVKGIYLQDLEKGTSFETVPTTDLLLCKTAEEFVFSGEVAIAYGYFAMTPLSLKSKQNRQRFVLLHLSRSENTAELLGAQADEMRAAREKRQSLCKESGAFEKYLTKRLAEIHQVVETKMSSRFALAIKLVLLQALSDGGVSANANQRISAYFLSEPGQGKGVLSRYAETLAPLSATTQPALTTVPGLSVKMQQKQGQGWVTTPGSIALAYRGVMTSHDAHRFPEKDAAAFQAIFMATAEEGIFTPSKAGNSPFILECALHLNGNHKHLVEGRPCPKGPRARLADIGMALDLFSRMDVVISLCIGDEIRPLSQKFVAQNLNHKMTREDQRAASRELKLLVADARDSIKEVDLSPIEKELQQTVADMGTILYEEQANLRGPEENVVPPNALLLRMARAVRKLVIAQARLDGRAQATLADLDVAKELIRLKLEVVRWICGDADQVIPQGSFLNLLRKAEGNAEDRQTKILERCSDKGDLTAQEISNLMDVGLRTVIRDLLHLGLEPTEGRYRIPTPHQYEWQRQMAEQERVAKEAQEAEMRRIAIAQLIEKGMDPSQAEQTVGALAEQSAPEVVVLSEEEMARRMDPDRERPKGPHRFYDSLPKVPLELHEACFALLFIKEGTRYFAIERLLKYALTQKIDKMLHFEARHFATSIQEEAYPRRFDALEPLVPVLRDPNWERRAGIVLAMYGSTKEMPEIHATLEDALRRDDIPEAIRRHIESAIARRKFIVDTHFKVEIKL